MTRGCAWRHLPPSFGVTVPTAHRRFTEWTAAGLWRDVHRAVLDELGGKGMIDWSRAVLDGAHGFRPRRGCHTALREIANTWTGTTWFIEGDIADCFGSLDHDLMIGVLSEKIHDNRFLRLVRNMLTAGYLEDWKWGATLSGAPQGGVASPILSSIYLHKLDEFVETVLIPEYTRGGRRARNPAYLKLQTQLATARRRGDRVTARALRRRMVSPPSAAPDDPDYRRLRYCRYADDHLLGFAGPKAEAEEIKQRLTVFLRDEIKLDSPTTRR